MAPKLRALNLTAPELMAPLWSLEGFNVTNDTKALT